MGVGVGGHCMYSGLNNKGNSLPGSCGGTGGGGGGQASSGLNKERWDVGEKAAQISRV